MGTTIAERSPSLAGQRGHKGRERRTQMLEAADLHFRAEGYASTTVAELAKAIGVSPAYIHKIFGSKQGLANAVCQEALGRVRAELLDIVGSQRPVATRLRLLYQTVARRGAELFYHDRKLHELAVTACTEKWPAVQEHQAALHEMIRKLIEEGREQGEFERKTLIGETSLSVQQTLELFSLPLFLKQHPDDTETRALCVADLVLRSLAP